MSSADLAVSCSDSARGVEAVLKYSDNGLWPRAPNWLLGVKYESEISRTEGDTREAYDLLSSMMFTIELDLRRRISASGSLVGLYLWPFRDRLESPSL